MVRVLALSPHPGCSQPPPHLQPTPRRRTYRQPPTASLPLALFALTASAADYLCPAPRSQDLSRQRSSFLLPLSQTLSQPTVRGTPGIVDYRAISRLCPPAFSSTTLRLVPLQAIPDRALFHIHASPSPRKSGVQELLLFQQNSHNRVGPQRGLFPFLSPFRFSG